MLAEPQKALIRQSICALREGVAGFRSRRAQLEMVAAVANALARCREEGEPPGEGGHLAVIEAGTGTGKSFGALVPALVVARTRGRRLVVSSATVALQHRYADKDVPALQGLLPFAFSVAVAKGRKRYACPAKLYTEAQGAGQGDLTLEDGGAAADTGPTTASRLRELADALHAGRWSGDRDALPEPVGNSLWERTTTDRHDCAGGTCPHFARCPYQAARKRIRQADLVIANHDLVLATLELGGQGALPAPAEALYVFDEAHSLPAKAVEHLSAGHSILGTVHWLAGARDAVRDAVLGLHLDESAIGESQTDFQRIESALHELLRRIRAAGGFDDQSARRFKSGALPPWCEAAGRQILSASEALQGVFTTLRDQVLERAGSMVALASGGSPVRMDRGVRRLALSRALRARGSGALQAGGGPPVAHAGGPGARDGPRSTDREPALGTAAAAWLARLRAGDRAHCADAAIGRAQALEGGRCPRSMNPTGEAARSRYRCHPAAGKGKTAGGARIALFLPWTPEGGFRLGQAVCRKGASRAAAAAGAAREAGAARFHARGRSLRLADPGPVPVDGGLDGFHRRLRRGRTAQVRHRVVGDP